MSRILVTGATGGVGRHLTGRLLEGGAQVRAISRDPQRAARVLPPDVEVVGADLGDVHALEQALDQVDAAYVMLDENAGAAFAKAAQAAPGLRHLVVLSATAAQYPEVDNPMFRKHVRGEAHLAAAGVPTTLLRPCAFATLALLWAPAVRGDGTIRVPHPELTVPLIDPRDIAEVAAVALLGGPETWARRALTLTGPESLDMADRVRVLGEVLGRPLRLEHQPEEEWIRQASAHTPEAWARALVGVERFFAAHPQSVVDTVAQVTGRPARSFRDWVADHAAAFE
ncbi:SDR family NAD(P)-dependent oxidoreductase [Streptacidiphilus jiangxiensis]|uniref:Uncharacterized conserved protein YbjT, contains NAD(P)-binding and DUF2867 domains n=1 Tax=Streptacidiphilus jiangxiensis TaxID=235985 RepID=A0A1H7JN63_STRJI|nr:SDR family NAD(P)-dependent oxidoreductase [Streptacidiphilus jiangxiensis]SEK76021.1 Uncharacterized conserved protein YbjT, contains NAD(P)-binding and DUF2867 domains [Streptacidiphilus jiangxiensis]